MQKADISPVSPVPARSFPAYIIYIGHATQTALTCLKRALARFRTCPRVFTLLTVIRRSSAFYTPFPCLHALFVPVSRRTFVSCVTKCVYLYRCLYLGLYMLYLHILAGTFPRFPVPCFAAPRISPPNTPKHTPLPRPRKQALSRLKISPGI